MIAELTTPSEVMIGMADGQGEDKADRALYYTDELSIALPGLRQAFEFADLQYQRDPRGQLKNLESSVFTVMHEHTTAICSLRYSGESSKSNAINVTSHGFSDYPPLSSSADIDKYTVKSNPGLRDKQIAMPNTWSAITKAASLHDVRQQYGIAMPQLDIYRPLHLWYRGGDFSKFGGIVEAAVACAQDRIHGKHSETQISELHLGGLSLGASEVVSGAAKIKQRSEKLDVRSVTAQELIMGLRYLELIKFGGLHGEPSKQRLYNMPKIYEPLMRLDVDRHGNELTMAFRNLGAMGKMAVKLGNGLPKPEKTTAAMEYLAEQKVPVTVALAKNSFASSRTAQHLPDSPKVKLVTIDTLPGKRIGHIANEHVAGVVAVSLLGISRGLGTI